VRAKVIRIGNSRGIRIPKRALETAGLRDEVDLEVARGRLVVRPARRTRAGWEEAFERMASRGDDELLITGGGTTWDRLEWRW
jgi:antitoxin MazE